MIKWQSNIATLEDGWYWRRINLNDLDAECIEVNDGWVIDSRPIDSHGIDWEIYEHQDFGLEWYGPLEVPK
jgi:hypothetical protein